MQAWHKNSIAYFQCTSKSTQLNWNQSYIFESCMISWFDLEFCVENEINELFYSSFDETNKQRVRRYSILWHIHNRNEIISVEKTIQSFHFPFAIKMYIINTFYNINSNLKNMEYFNTINIDEIFLLLYFCRFLWR